VACICCFLPLWIYLIHWPFALFKYCKRKWKYRDHVIKLREYYRKQMEAHQEAERQYDILKPSYETARAQWYATHYAQEKERVTKEYTEQCIKYDQDKALWARTVFIVEKERLMKEYEASLKAWMDLYGPSAQSDFRTSLTAPLLDARSVSVPIAFTINETTKTKTKKTKNPIFPDSSSFF